MTNVGYARVSTTAQDEALQLDALTAAGCPAGRIYIDKLSSMAAHRPELDKALDNVREGDTLVVWRLDRLGRSLKHLVGIVTDLGERGVEFRSLKESIDTTTPSGRLTFHLFAAMAEFERDLIRDRTQAGLTAARARGRHGGRPAGLSADQVVEARRMYEAGDKTAAQIAQILGVGRSTLYRHLGKSAAVGSAGA